LLDEESYRGVVSEAADKLQALLANEGNVVMLMEALIIAVREA
jgi:hypothetical protein